MLRNCTKFWCPLIFISIENIEIIKLWGAGGGAG